ncbi:MAG: H-NS histone family protein [Burkholderiales bacterium]|nr:H-NS histone family protein [Burkholderiales bacterium]
MATYNPLLIKRQKLAEQQAELERQIALERAQARAAALLHIKQLIATFAITSDEIAPPASPRSSKASKQAKAGTKGKARKAGRPRKTSAALT